MNLYVGDELIVHVLPNPNKGIKRNFHHYWRCRNIHCIYCVVNECFDASLTCTKGFNRLGDTVIVIAPKSFQCCLKFRVD